MIHESWYWKEPLLKSAEHFIEWQHLNDIDDELFVEIEQAILIGFYSIRKLFESYKLSDEMEEKRVHLELHPFVGYEVTWRNDHKFDEHYDFSRTNCETKGYRFLCNLFIHSFVFVTSINDHGGFDGVFISSDKTKESKLYAVSVEQLIDIFQSVGNDEIVRSEWRKGFNGEKDTVIRLSPSQCIEKGLRVYPTLDECGIDINKL
ncbi:hypothetical protein [Halodesulfovibrio sp. MK-HDV]|jgi:hypothetical protein|uniref:hypothetical protein n=1 Tax=Halodesulfovibrio sp. MK-HDV TaxID=2599925 RepID=UPI0013698975|nr:hypothetical protein [Halodesulfovibrio sp. MK-HDV]KAF1074532.1 hypothetical protein MKHDV_02607 [Halodesulfovibrio sp. MK-HDV]